MFVTAWIIGLSLSVWSRMSGTLNPAVAQGEIQNPPKAIRPSYPPSPRSLLMASILFTGLAVLAEIPDARKTATLAAYGFDLTVLIQILSRSKGQYTYLAGNWPPKPAPDTTVIPTGPGSFTKTVTPTSLTTSPQAVGTGTLTT